MIRRDKTVLTIGHSDMAYEQFLGLLRRHDVTALADVRSVPYSRRRPEYNRDTLRDELKSDGISYVFLGEELGGRPKESRYFCDGVADYEKMATDDLFKSGVERVVMGSDRHRIALMCSERSPLDCHRCLLVARALAHQGLVTLHILHDGGVKSQSDIEGELLEMAGQIRKDLFLSAEERLTAAYRARAMKVAFASRSSHEPAGAS